ncbi:MAG: endonuclease domain-containing protein [Nitrospinota bacterium]
MIKQGEKRNLNLKRKLRGEMTFAEKRLWLRLKGKQINGLKFRRQHGIGDYIVDFYCPEKRLVIEVDGDVHAYVKQIERDREREGYLKALGLQIVRYTNWDILTNLEEVVEDLFRRVSK